MFRVISLRILAAVLIGFPVGFILSVMLTPFLWSLEGVVHMELAGHSGPEDWVYEVVTGMVIIVVFFLSSFVIKKK